MLIEELLQQSSDEEKLDELLDVPAYFVVKVISHPKVVRAKKRLAELDDEIYA